MSFQCHFFQLSHISYQILMSSLLLSVKLWKISFMGIKINIIYICILSSCDLTTVHIYIKMVKKFWNQDRVVITCLHKKDQSSLSWHLDFCLYLLLLVCFLFCLSSGKLMHYLSACGQNVTVTSYHNLSD